MNTPQLVKGYAKTQHPVRDQLAAQMVKFVFGTARLVPMSMCRFFGRSLGSLMNLIDSRQRRIAAINLKFAFGNRFTPAQIDDLILRNFQQWGMTGLEWAKHSCLEKVLKEPKPSLFEVVGREHWEKAKAQSDAVILLSAHFGNWEYAHAFYATRFNRLNWIVRKIDNAYIEQRRVAFNNQYNVNILYKNGGLKPAIKNLRKGEDLILFADQNVNEFEGADCLFFGRRTSTPTIVASLAKKYKLPVLPMFAIRKGNTSVHRITFLEPLSIAPDDSITAIAQKQNDVIEKVVRAHPDHWLWMHRKWKHYHRDIYDSVAR